MRFVVLGAGAVGGVIGARLAQHGHDVVLIARGQHYQAIRDKGLQLESPDETVTLHIPVVDHPAAVAWTADDVLLLATKTQDTEAALDSLAAAAPRLFPSSAHRMASPTSGWRRSALPAFMACSCGARPTT